MEIGYVPTNPAAYVAPNLPLPGERWTFLDSTDGYLKQVDSAGTISLLGDSGVYASKVKRGTATLVAGVATISGLGFADTNYSIGLQVFADENVYPSAKVAGGFQINSGNPASTATVDWTATRS